MENFNLKQYIYEKRVEGMTDGRIAETLGITVEEMSGLLSPAPEHKKEESVKKSEPPKAPEKKAKVEEKKPEPPKPPVEKKNPEEVKDPDPSWLED